MRLSHKIGKEQQKKLGINLPLSTKDNEENHQPEPVINIINIKKENVDLITETPNNNAKCKSTKSQKETFTIIGDKIQVMVTGMECYSFLRLLRISGADQLGALHVAAPFGA